MLEYLRNAVEKPVAKILIGLLAFSFVGWGVAEWIFGTFAGDNTLVRVGDGEVTMQQFNIEKQNHMAKMTREQQRAVYADAEMADKLNATVLADLTSQRLAENRAYDLGLVVSDGRIANEIRNFPEFQQDGKFSPYLFDAVLNNSGYSEGQFAAVLRNQVLRGMVMGAVAVPVPVPEFAARATYNARYGKRDIEYTTVKFAEYNVGNPTDEQLKTYYAQNPKTVPEYRTVSYVLVPADLDKPDAYDAGYAIAVKVEDDIIAGESFEQAAKSHGAKYVSLKPFSADKRPDDAILTEKMVAKLFDMDEGLESELIETKQGFVIARVDKVAPAHTAEFDSVKSELVDGWRVAEQEKKAYVRANELLVDLKKDGKLPNKVSASVSRVSGAPIAVLNAAFNSALGESRLVAAPDAFYVLTVKEETSPQVDAKKLADVHKELTKMSTTTVVEDYDAFLKREYPIKVNEKVYNRFFAN